MSEKTAIEKMVKELEKRTEGHCEAWGLDAVMTKEQRTEWGIFSAYQVAHLWKDKHPKEYAIWDKWASGKDRSETTGAAARAAVVAAAESKMLAKILRYGVKVLNESKGGL